MMVATVAGWLADCLVALASVWIGREILRLVSDMSPIDDLWRHVTEEGEGRGTMHEWRIADPPNDMRR